MIAENKLVGVESLLELLDGSGAVLGEDSPELHRRRFGSTHVSIKCRGDAADGRSWLREWIEIEVEGTLLVRAVSTLTCDGLESKLSGRITFHLDQAKKRMVALNPGAAAVLLLIDQPLDIAWRAVKVTEAQ